MASLTVREMQAADLPHLLELEQQSFPGDRISRRSWLRLCRSHSALVLVATLHREVVGAAVVLTREGAGVARLYSVAAAPVARRVGVGRALIGKALVRARDAGCVDMRLECRSDNASAHRFFRHLGFEAFGPVVAAYYQDGMDAVRFRQRLDSPRSSPAAPPRRQRTRAAGPKLRNDK